MAKYLDAFFVIGIPTRPSPPTPLPPYKRCYSTPFLLRPPIAAFGRRPPFHAVPFCQPNRVITILPGGFTVLGWNAPYNPPYIPPPRQFSPPSWRTWLPRSSFPCFTPVVDHSPPESEYRKFAFIINASKCTMLGHTPPDFFLVLRELRLLSLLPTATLPDIVNPLKFSGRKRKFDPSPRVPLGHTVRLRRGFLR